MRCAPVSMLSSALSGNSCSTGWIRCFISDAKETVAGSRHRRSAKDVCRSGYRQMSRAIGRPLFPR